MPRFAPIALAMPLMLIATCAVAQPSTPAPQVSTDPGAAPAGVYTLDPAHTSVTMKVSHLGLSYYTLRFDGVQGSLSYDPAHPEADRLQVSIDANSIDTGDPAFNRQIAADVFDSAKYPQIRFVSTSVRPSGEDKGTVVGDLDFHGVAKPVSLDVIFNGAARDGEHGERLGFSADALIRRSDFGAAKYLPAVGDDVSLLIEAEFKN